MQNKLINAINYQVNYGLHNNIKVSAGALFYYASNTVFVFINYVASLPSNTNPFFSLIINTSKQFNNLTNKGYKSGTLPGL